jgi:hypothetical protein
MKKQILLSALAAVALAACTANEADEPLADDAVAATFSGQVSVTSTRSDANYEAWTSAHGNIGISAKAYTNSSRQDISDYENVLYTVSNLSEALETATFSTSTKFYFQSATEAASFVAYAPYVGPNSSDYADGIIKVKAGDDYAVPDYIWAQTDEALTYKTPKASLRFAHKMAKMTVNVSLAEEMNTTIKSASLSNLVTDGTLTLADGTVALAEAPDTYSASFPVTEDASTQAALKDFIVLPQGGLVVTILTENGNTYQTTLSKTLASGNSYTFNVTANNTALEVEATITEWNEEDAEEQDATMTVLPSGGNITRADDVWLYDLVFSDGTFMHTTKTNGGDFVKSLNLNEFQKEAARGIVFWLGSPIEEGDKLMPAEFSHGLIVALKDAVDPSEGSMWSKNTSSLSKGNWFSTNFSGCSWIDFQYDWSDSELQQMRGYTNTAILRYYNTEVRGGDEDYIIYPVKYIDEYGETNSIANTSGWYFASPQELAVLRMTPTYKVKWRNDDSDPHTSETAVNTVAGLLGESIATSLSTPYWSSTRQINDSYKKANYVTHGRIAYHDGDWKTNIRAISAF